MVTYVTMHVELKVDPRHIIIGRYINRTLHLIYNEGVLLISDYLANRYDRFHESATLTDSTHTHTRLVLHRNTSTDDD